MEHQWNDNWQVTEVLNEIPVSVPLSITNPICQDSNLGNNTVYEWRFLYSEDYPVIIQKKNMYSYVILLDSSLCFWNCVYNV